MKKTIKTITAMMLVLCTVIGAIALDFGVPTNEECEKTVGVVAYAAEVRKGGFNGNSYSTRQVVYLKQWRDWWSGNIKTASSAKVRVCTFNQSGKRTSGKFKIKVTTPYDSNFVEYISGSSTNKITLNFGYDTYYIQIMRRGTDSTNVANCYWWSYDASSNCSFSPYDW